MLVISGAMYYTIHNVRMADKYVCYYDVLNRPGVYHMFCVDNESFCKYCQYLGTIYVEEPWSKTITPFNATKVEFNVS